MLLDPDDARPAARRRARPRRARRPRLAAHGAARRPGRDRLAGVRLDRGRHAGARRGPPRARRRRRGLGAAGGLGHASFAAPEGALRDDPKYDAAEGGVPVGAAAAARLRPPHPRRGARRRSRAGRAQRRALLPARPRRAGRQRAAARRARHGARLACGPRSPGLLPRQGVPPAFSSWEAYADYLAWGRRGGLFPGEGEPWWEARGHDELGTIELRVPDAQTTAAEAAGVLALGAGLIAWLAERYDAGEPLPVHDTIRIAENRWRALRHGLAGALLDLDSGEPQPARARVLELIDACRARRGAPRRRGGARSRAHTRRPQRRRAPARARRRAGPAARRRVARDAFLP